MPDYRQTYQEHLFEQYLLDHAMHGSQSKTKAAEPHLKFLIHHGIAKHEYAVALANLEKLEKIYESVDYFDLAKVYKTMSQCYAQLENFRDAVSIGKRAIELADKTGEANLILDAMDHLSQVYVAIQDFQSAKETQQRCIEVGKEYKVSTKSFELNLSMLEGKHQKLIESQKNFMQLLKKEAKVNE